MLNAIGTTTHSDDRVAPPGPVQIAEVIVRIANDEWLIVTDNATLNDVGGLMLGDDVRFRWQTGQGTWSQDIMKVSADSLRCMAKAQRRQRPRAATRKGKGKRTKGALNMIGQQAQCSLPNGTSSHKVLIDAAFLQVSFCSRLLVTDNETLNAHGGLLPNDHLRLRWWLPEEGRFSDYYVQTYARYLDCIDAAALPLRTGPYDPQEPAVKDAIGKLTTCTTPGGRFNRHPVRIVKVERGATVHSHSRTLNAVGGMQIDDDVWVAYWLPDQERYSDELCLVSSRTLACMPVLRPGAGPF